MGMHYVYIVRDTGTNRNYIETGPRLSVIEKDLAAYNKRAALKKNAGRRHLIYYECLSSPAEAAKRREFLLSEEGAKESRRWLRRWDRTEAID